MLICSCYFALSKLFSLRYVPSSLFWNIRKLCECVCVFKPAETLMKTSLWNTGGNTAFLNNQWHQWHLLIGSIRVLFPCSNALEFHAFHTPLRSNQGDDKLLLKCVSLSLSLLLSSTSSESDAEVGFALLLVYLRPLPAVFTVFCNFHSFRSFCEGTCFSTLLLELKKGCLQLFLWLALCWVLYWFLCREDW